MAEENDPTKKYLEAAEKYQQRLQKLWKVVFKKVSHYLRAMTYFTKSVVKAAKELAAAVGKAVIDKMINAAQAVEKMISTIPDRLKIALLLGKRIIALIKKAADPNTIIAALKKLFSRYVRMIKQIFLFITDLIQQLDILAPVLGVIGTFQSVLRMLFSWITEVTGASDGAVKANRMLKKVWKEMKKEVKEAELLRKQVMKLKVVAP